MDARNDIDAAMRELAKMDEFVAEQRSTVTLLRELVLLQSAASSPVPTDPLDDITDPPEI